MTTVAAYLPARRVSRLAPLAAIRGQEQPPPSCRRYIAGGILVAASLALELLGVPLLLVGVALLGPLVVPRLASLIGLPGRRLGGLPGGLGVQNSVRNPRRTASTAGA